MYTDVYNLYIYIYYTYMYIYIYMCMYNTHIATLR